MSVMARFGWLDMRSEGSILDMTLELQSTVLKTQITYCDYYEDMKLGECCGT